jgi:hypothetical protein
MANFPFDFRIVPVLNVAVTFRSSDHYKKLMTAAIRKPPADLSEKELAQKKQCGDHFAQVPGGLPSLTLRIGCGALAVRPVR